MDGEGQRGDGTGSSPASVLAILAGMRGVGLDVDAVCAAAGLSRAELETRVEFIPSGQLAAMWREGARLSGRTTFGLAVGAAVPLGEQLVDYVACTSATLRQALEQVARYHRLITRNGDFHLRPEGALTLFELLPNLPLAAIPPQLLEYVGACLAVRVRDFTGRPAREVWFPHGPLGPREEYGRVLGVPARFGAPSLGVLLDDETLSAPCRGHDPSLYRLLRAHAELLLERAPRDSTFRGQVRRVVIEKLKHGEPEVGAVARVLATSERSLQRRLQEEGSTFRDVVDDARHELALVYLGDKALSVADVAYMLGYSEAGAFVRAFKRWTGRTPGETR